MPVTHLRTYTLKSAQLASKYAQRWVPTAASLAKQPYNITTRGVWINETNPKQVLAMVEFQDNDDPAKKIEMYVASEDFGKDLGTEITKGDFEGVESETLKEVKV